MFPRTYFLVRYVINTFFSIQVLFTVLNREIKKNSKSIVTEGEANVFQPTL